MNYEKISKIFATILIVIGIGLIFIKLNPLDRIDTSDMNFNQEFVLTDAFDEAKKNNLESLCVTAGEAIGQYVFVSDTQVQNENSITVLVDTSKDINSEYQKVSSTVNQYIINQSNENVERNVDNEKLMTCIKICVITFLICTLIFYILNKRISNHGYILPKTKYNIKLHKIN